MAFTKLFSDLILSTIWREPDHVRILWITMLAIKDRWHIVNASLPGLADAARITLPQCQDAINILMNPDPFSRSDEFEGRRIRKVEGGWEILNGEHYRNKMSLDDRREYQRIKQREYRERKKETEKTQKTQQKQRPLPSCQQSGQQLTHTEADTDTDTDNPYLNNIQTLHIVEQARPRSAATTDDLPEIDYDDPKYRESPAYRKRMFTNDDPILDHWRTLMAKPRARMTKDREKALRAARKAGYSEEDLEKAVVGCYNTPHNMGRNDRHQRYNDLALILRDGQHIDRFIENYEHPPHPKGSAYYREIEAELGF